MSHPVEGTLVAVTPILATISVDYVPIVVALIAGAVPLTGVILSHRRAGRKIEQIHVLVNSRLTQALNEISDLKKTLEAKDHVLAEQREAIQKLPSGLD